MTVTPSRTSGDADVTVSGALTFTPDNWSSAQTVTVRAAEDLDATDDTAEIGHTVSGGDYGSETAPSVTVTVDDDEFASTGLRLSANIKEVLESAGATAITVTAALNDGSRLSDTPVEVSVGAGTSTATAGTDFATVNDFTVTIAAGTVSQTATFTLEPTDDDVDEGYFESVEVSGTSTVPAFSVIGTAVNILDDDDRGVTVSDSSLTVKEGSSETYTVVLDSEPTGDVTVTPSRTSGDADVTVSGALTFTPDNWSSAQAVTVRAAEDLDANDDTAEIGHTVSGGDYGSETAQTVTVTVDDDELDLDRSVAVGEHQKFARGVRRRHHDHGDGDGEQRRALERHASDGERGRGHEHGDFGHRFRHGQQLPGHDCRRHPVANRHLHPGSDRRRRGRGLF